MWLGALLDSSQPLQEPLCAQPPLSGIPVSLTLKPPLSKDQGMRVQVVICPKMPYWKAEVLIPVLNGHTWRQGWDAVNLRNGDNSAHVLSPLTYRLLHLFVHTKTEVVLWRMKTELERDFQTLLSFLVGVNVWFWKEMIEYSPRFCGKCVLKHTCVHTWNHSGGKLKSNLPRCLKMSTHRSHNTLINTTVILTPDPVNV